MKRYCYVLVLSLCCWALGAQRLHYWFDTLSPSRIQRISLRSSGGEYDAEIDTKALDVGLHTLHCYTEARDHRSALQSTLFYKPYLGLSATDGVLQAFLDNLDGKPVAQSALRLGLQLLTLKTTQDVDTGLHTLYLRVMGRDGSKSALASSLFYHVKPAPSSGKQVLQYWFDDRLTEKRTIDLSKGEVDRTYSITFDTKGLEAGLHHITIQMQNKQGVVSGTQQALFYKSAYTATTTYTAVEYWFDGQMEQKRTYSFAQPLNAGSEVMLELDKSGLMRGEHTLHCTPIDTDGKRGAETTIKFVEERGIPSEVYLRRLSPDPNELVPSKLMEGSLAYFHYQVTDSKEKDAKGVAGVSIKYEVLVGDKVEQRETEASDVNGVVSLPISTGVPLLSIGKRIQHRCTSAKVALGNQEIQLSQIDIEPLVLTVIPLRSNELEIGFGGYAKAKGEISGKLHKKAKGSIGAFASAGIKASLKFERDEEDNITNILYGGKLSAKLGGKIKGEFGKNKLSLGGSGEVERGVTFSGEPSKELLFASVSSLILDRSDNIFTKRAVLIGVNALKDYMENQYQWDFDKIEVSNTINKGFEVELEYGKETTETKKLFTSNVDGWNAALKLNLSWTSEDLSTPTGKSIGSKVGRKAGLEFSGHVAKEFKKLRITKRDGWKALESVGNLRGRMKFPSKSEIEAGGNIEIGLTTSSTLEHLHRDFTKFRYKKLEMSNSFGVGAELKAIGELKKYIEALGAIEELDISLARKSTLKMQASGYFADHIGKNRSRLKTLFPGLDDNIWNLGHQIFLPFKDEEVEQELKMFSESADLSKANLEKDFKESKEISNEFNLKLSINLISSPPSSPIEWSISLGGFLDVGITYPAGESYWSTKYKRMFPTYYSYYYIAPMELPTMGPEVASWSGTFLTNVKRAFEPKSPVLNDKARLMCKPMSKEVRGAFEFWTQPRFYSSGLSRIQTLRASKQEHISEFKFDFGADCLPDGAQATFYQFYPGGDLMGFAGQEEIIILSDFCSIGATHNGEALKETSQPFKIRASIGADDLKLLNFAPNTSVHLFYSAKDDGQWVDLGGIDKPIEAKGLGIYALAAKMEADEIAPELSLRLDKEHKMIVVEARENVAIRPKSVRAQINLKPVDIQLLSNKSYAIPLSEEQLMSESVLVFVEMSDLAGNRAQIIRDLPVNKTSAKVSVSRLEAKLYPTQTRTLLWLETPAEFLGCPVRIYDASGATHRELVVRETTTKLDVSDLPAGNYWLRVGAETHRFVKQE